METASLTKQTCAQLGQFPDLVTWLDRDLKIVAQNQAAVNACGERIGEPCHKVYFDREEPCPGCLREQVLRDGEPMRWFAATADAEDRPDAAYFEVTLLPHHDDDGNLVGLLEVLRDATLSFRMEHHLIETSAQLDQEVLSRTEQLEKLRNDQTALVQAEKMASLGRLVAGLTHEIHTPLGAIISGLDMTRNLLATIADDDAELPTKVEQLLSLAEIEQMALERIGKILRSLKLFSHLDQAEEEWFDLHEGIDACLALLAHELRERVEVVRDFGPLPQVRCRPDAINQVFMNLLVNASQAIDETGTIRIVTRLENADQVLLEFHDDGKGIEARNLDQVFEPGFTTKPRGVGTGLGLAISFSTLQAHNGSIDVESRPGEGTTFRVRLPVGGLRS